ncbi:electron transfer flavoprotein subunit beta/FixA family protein [Marinicella sediminis]|uniref:Electron transfer flavoprotein subunit beta n=1 Tax=Marinicella sediminis TaxID=1792834 RepID=A0ABV7J9V9_9GAMM|nr:electron transfer flavoprotein subunit beta/FixA family protein [Marinicella sediminis]
MKILVAIKRVVDYNVRVQVKPDGSGVATDGVKMSINPFDEIAIEEALRIKEQGKADEVVVVTIGTNDSQQQLRTAMAMGADRAILVESDVAVQPLQAAQVLLKVIEQESPGLVITGKQAIDDDNNQTPQMLATLWNRPQATFASKIEFVDGGLQVTREVDAGLETIQVELPAVVSTDLRLNEPRFVKLPDIMKAKRKPLDVKAIGELAPDLQGKAIEVTQHEAPQPRQKGIMVETVDELIEILKDKGLVS